MMQNINYYTRITFGLKPMACSSTKVGTNPFFVPTMSQRRCFVFETSIDVSFSLPGKENKPTRGGRPPSTKSSSTWMQRRSRSTISPRAGQHQEEVVPKEDRDNKNSGRSSKLKKYSYSDKFIKHTYKKNKLSQALVGTLSNETNAGIIKKAVSRGDIVTEGSTPIWSPAEDRHPIGSDVYIHQTVQKKALLFLTQGLGSNEILKLRSLLGRFNISLTKIPLRVWASSEYVRRTATNETRKKKNAKTNDLQLFGDLLVLATSTMPRDKYKMSGEFIRKNAVGTKNNAGDLFIKYLHGALINTLGTKISLSNSNLGTSEVASKDVDVVPSTLIKHLGGGMPKADLMPTWRDAAIGSRGDTIADKDAFNSFNQHVPIFPWDNLSSKPVDLPTSLIKQDLQKKVNDEWLNIDTSNENPIEILLGHLVTNNLTYAGVVQTTLSIKDGLFQDNWNKNIKGPATTYGTEPTLLMTSRRPHVGTSTKIFLENIYLYADFFKKSHVPSGTNLNNIFNRAALPSLDPFFKVNPFGRNYLIWL